MFVGTAIIVVLALAFLFPRQNDVSIASSLELKVVPFLVQNDVKFYSDRSGCKQIKYGAIEAASPKGCAYRENISDPPKKATPDFSSADEKLFTATKQTLVSASPERIVQIGTEFTRYDAPDTPRPPQEIGTAFYVDCFFCRTRYVYWPNYRSLLSDWEGEISYTPINENWYRVDEDWN